MSGWTDRRITESFTFYEGLFMSQQNKSTGLYNNRTLGPTTYPKRHPFIDIDNVVEWDSHIAQRFPQAEKLQITGLEPGPGGSCDAKGERWLSVGQKDEELWNWGSDDIHCWSRFCFDGWRYLRFEMPANAPYDVYLEAGMTWWGAYSDGDGVVDLPLQLEKIIVERRTHVIHVDELLPANPADVVLGDLYAEYAHPADQTEEAIRLSRLRMPVIEQAMQ